MIWKTKTHQFTATVCQRTGKTCPALARLARAMTVAMKTAAPTTTPEFQVEGSSDLTYCPEGCTARFWAQKDQIRVFCGTCADTPTKTLDGYADMMFGTSFTPLPAGVLTDLPCAMLEVSSLVPRPAAPISEHLSA
ncbi:hypothetical protein [Ruegeria halocynthiae]|uniref:hypothetical protein n=1 Tax=Ruegeria halocynthiae TaxID=985054 RepID=UPI00055A2710|nr:hypothetical protein [Ruegeria halocynthiae]